MGRVTLGLLTVVSLSLPVVLARPASAAISAASPKANSHWDWCDSQAVKYAPSYIWARIDGATSMHKDIPSTYWSDLEYRIDLARIICYESTFEYHAENVGQYGWFQMDSGLIYYEGVKFDEYWSGSPTEPAGWDQGAAAERYIHARYGTPVAAWAHEMNYGWY